MPAHWGPDWTWFALLVAPQREFEVESALRDDDHFVFVPLRHVSVREHRRSKRKVIKARAQYPGYVFLGQPPGFELPWLQIMDVSHVQGVLAYQGEPMAIHEPTMTAMIAGDKNSRPRAYINAQGKKRRNKGQRTAEIVTGPYQGRTVRLIEIMDGDPELYELLKAA
jgi:transcription antitermination factor NusG